MTGIEKILLFGVLGLVVILLWGTLIIQALLQRRTRVLYWLMIGPLTVMYGIWALWVLTADLWWRIRNRIRPMRIRTGQPTR